MERVLKIGTQEYTKVVCMDEPSHGGACHRYAVKPARCESLYSVEEAAEAVHDAYLETCGRLGWDVKPENQVPYSELSDDSKELDRASVRAITNELPPALICFQKGAIKEHGVNGCHHEDLIAIVIDRLEHFQNGKFACKENQGALDCLSDALAHLGLRTIDRKERGVEGTSVE